MQIKGYEMKQLQEGIIEVRMSKLPKCRLFNMAFTCNEVANIDESIDLADLSDQNEYVLLGSKFLNFLRSAPAYKTIDMCPVSYYNLVVSRAPKWSPETDELRRSIWKRVHSLNPNNLLIGGIKYSSLKINEMGEIDEIWLDSARYLQEALWAAHNNHSLLDHFLRNFVKKSGIEPDQLDYLINVVSAEDVFRRLRDIIQLNRRSLDEK